jgi:hypothetical protein
MPYDEPDETDPMMLVGVELPSGAEADSLSAEVFAEEFARMGLAEEELMNLFKNPFYAGAHRALLALGEARVREIVRECARPWSSVRIREVDSDPERNMIFLPVLENRKGECHG